VSRVSFYAVELDGKPVHRHVYRDKKAAERVLADLRTNHPEKEFKLEEYDAHLGIRSQIFARSAKRREK